MIECTVNIGVYETILLRNIVDRHYRRYKMPTSTKGMDHLRLHRSEYFGPDNLSEIRLNDRKLEQAYLVLLSEVKQSHIEAVLSGPKRSDRSSHEFMDCPSLCPGYLT